MATSAKQSSNLSFADFSLPSTITQAVAELGYTTPTPVQAQAIPHILKHGDILGVSQTGTGKTAAFALPLLARLQDFDAGVQVLCLTPTRELALQVNDAFNQYAKHILGFRSLAIYGGSSYNAQIKQLAKGVQVVVGTPGRVMDLIERKKLKLGSVQSVVLDEADEMLKMGFIDDVEWILSHTPKEKQTVLFSATMPARIREISKTYLKNPLEITIQNNENSTKNITQKFIFLNQKDKQKTLKHLLETLSNDGVIIFNRTKKGTVDVAEFLQTLGYKAEALNGDVSQEQREQIVKKLKNGVIDIITATDVAARGIDVVRLSHVINYDMADDIATYTHRIGRVGRAGRRGDAILFLSQRDKRVLKEIEKSTKSTISKYEFPTLKQINKTKVYKLFQRIDSINPQDIEEYKSLVNKYIAQYDNKVDVLELVAKVLYLEHKEQPFYHSEVLTLSEEPQKGRERSRRGGKRSDSKEGGRRRDNRGERRGEKQPRPKRNSKGHKNTGNDTNKRRTR